VQVPPNNQPVEEAPDLLNLESEMEAMEKVRAAVKVFQ